MRLSYVKSIRLLRHNPVNISSGVLFQCAAPEAIGGDPGEIDSSALPGCVVRFGIAPAGKANLLAGVLIGEVTEQAHPLALGTVIQAQIEGPGFLGAAVLLQIGFHAFFVVGQNSVVVHSLLSFLFWLSFFPASGMLLLLGVQQFNSFPHPVCPGRDFLCGAQLFAYRTDFFSELVFLGM